MNIVRESQSLPELIAGLAKQHGERCALGQAQNSGAASLSYRELWEGVQRGAARLGDAGLAKGDRVLHCLDARPEWPEALFAIMHAGLVAVPVVQGMPPEMVSAIATHAGVRGLVGGRGAHSELSAVGSIEFRFTVDELLAPGAKAQGGVTSARDDVALLAFTSGSTQQPRAVVLTHGNLLADLAALLEVRDAKPGDAFLSILPPAHLFEFMVGQIGPLACGAKVVYPGTRLPNRLVESLREDRITHACCVPALLHCLYDELLDELIAAGVIESERRGQSVGETACRLSEEVRPGVLAQVREGVRARIGDSLHTLALGGAALDPDWPPILQAMGIRAEVGYGLTEASPVVSMGYAEECPVGSVGRPLPSVEVRVGDGDELLLRGPTVTAGYYGDTAATEEAFAEGWLRTGDRGRVDADGFLFLTGRIKEAMVTAAGETIYPEEIEPCYASPLFAEWCVAPRVGADGNDLPTLFVVLTEGIQNGIAVDEAFVELRSNAPPRLRADTVICLEQPLPRTLTGKVRRRFLAEQFNNDKTKQ
jgi:long-chain acyl-CoA synthetase